MCGITGIIKFKEIPPGWGKLEEMTERISHRGPDAVGYYKNGQVEFGHRRLSILDLSVCANQPMADHSGRYHIVFNGEIYNYREVRNNIPDYPYSTNGDTEVILAAYSKWGPACLDHFAGMFAFAIWDVQDKKLFLARDRLGVKPLYYYQHENGFLFSSEIRSLLASGVVPKTLNHAAVSEFFQFQSVGYPHTIIKGVQSVDAGSYMIVGNSGSIIRKYWKLVNPQENNPHDKTGTKNKIRELLTQSVQRRMVSDAPIGAFLSGGIDSSAVVGLMASLSTAPVNTFTVGFKEKQFDESGYAEVIARKFNTCHQTLILQPNSFLDELLPALNAMDTPSGDGINSYTVSKAIRNNGVTVALSGVGGDELFAGYPIFKQYLRLMKWKKLWGFSTPFRKIIAATVFNKNNTREERYSQLLKVSDPGIASFYPAFRQILSTQMLARCTNLPTQKSSISVLLNDQYPGLAELPLLSQVSVAEYMGYTRNTLLNDMDQMSMAVSLEVREPFFDHQLVEFVLNIPDQMKYPSYPKQLLVESLGDLLPPEIVHRKKQGFLIPWNEWMKKDLLSFCESHIQAICQRDFINKEGLLSYWKRFTSNDPGVRWLEIWLFVVLEYWLQKNDVA